MLCPAAWLASANLNIYNFVASFAQTSELSSNLRLGVHNSQVRNLMKTKNEETCAEIS